MADGRAEPSQWKSFSSLGDGRSGFQSKIVLDGVQRVGYKATNNRGDAIQLPSVALKKSVAL
jgi:hypothetical protein